MDNSSIVRNNHAEIFSPPGPSPTLDEVKGQNLWLKRGIWAYFLLLIFEGALRKWFLPGLAGPLLIIRDPLALALIYLTWKQGLLPKTFYLFGIVVTGIVGIYTALLFGHGSLPVSLYGARILLIHFPFIFVIGSLFDKEDVIKIGKVVLWISIPMAFLIALQFFSPQSTWVNRGVGGEMEGAGFSGAMGFFRPPGTFSFTNGTSLFFSLAACFIFYFWIKPSGINRFILLGATGALFLAIPLSISRALLFQVVICLLFTLLAISRKPEYLGRMLIAGLGGILVLSILSQTSFFQTSTEAFTARFESASETEGGMEGVLLDRYLGGLLGALSSSTEQPFFGYGIGMGTNVGSQILSGERKFLIAEGEWARVIGELGPLFGLFVIFLRLGISAQLTFAGYRSLVNGNMLPWLLLSFGLLILPQGGWAQPTALGFSTLMAGLIIASLKESKTTANSELV